MLVDTFRQQAPAWTTVNPDDSSAAIFSQLSLCRNLADLPFPDRCTIDELETVIERVHGAIENLNLLAKGSWYPLDELTPLERQFLMERRLLDQEFITSEGPRGVYVAEDQNSSIMVNGIEHITMRSIVPGLDLNAAWSQLTALDDTLAATLDFAFDETLGFLTSKMDAVGTGLKAVVFLHLPTLNLGDSLTRHATGLLDHGVLMNGVNAGTEQGTPMKVQDLGYGPQEELLLEHSNEQSLVCNASGGIAAAIQDALGDLFVLRNQRSLGVSEEELLFQVRNGAESLIQDELAARTQQEAEGQRSIEDRIGRALGVARGAKLISFSEGLSLISSLRLGVETGRLTNIAIADVNQLLLMTQGAHLALGHGEACDAWTLTSDRADCFQKHLD